MTAQGFNSKVMIVGLVVLTSILTSVVTVLAVDFSDTSGSPFATEIDNITDAGCASGFPDGTFRPQDGVKRQQFAYWIDNCGSRSAEDDGSFVAGTPISDMSPPLEDATIDIGGAPGQTQYILVMGSFTAVGPPSGGASCPCEIRAELTLENADTQATVPGEGLGTAIVPVGSLSTTAAAFARFEVSTDTSYRAKIRGVLASVTSGGGGSLPVTHADVMMWTAPFNETGGAG